MAKQKYSAEWKIARVKEYLDGKGSYKKIADMYKMGITTLRGWTAKYLAYGEEAFVSKNLMKGYSADFKLICVKEVIFNNKSIEKVVAQYNISSNSVLNSWIRKYKNNELLEEYSPQQRVYKTAAYRKISIKEAEKIIEYCSSHDYDYKNTAAKFDVSYGQVYRLVKNKK
ncbi:helix-turn-helix domain-containing protein [Anaerovibrio sp. RM50]|uniref:helix-turn-helix domain-containing protein n=1 Tax=Anaerovibrio sp. RM50 TaxID=1200557 RepID=UPI0006870784|nr:helix-turn-helix domain-containing protein [Anaerovibrio sp. RM50]